MRNHPLPGQDVAEIDGTVPSSANGLGIGGTQAQRDDGNEGNTVGLDITIGLVSCGTEGTLGIQDGGVEAPATVQSGDLGIQAGPQRCRNPKHEQQLDTTNI